MPISASQIVNVTPNVLSPGGLGLVLNSILLTTNARVPTNTVQKFVSPIDVADYFGPDADETLAAQIYFQSYDNSNVKPGTIYFSQYNQVDVSAYLRGGDLTDLTIAQINALGTGSINIVMDGYTHTAASVNLSSVTSYSQVASTINTAINASEPQEATSSAGTIAGTTLTVGGTITGTFMPGQTVSGSGVTGSPIILSQLTGSTGLAGTYKISVSNTVASPVVITASATAIVVSFDSVSGALLFTSGITGAPSTSAYATGTLAAALFLTSASGAVLSQGAVAATPNSFMIGLTELTQNWATFMTMFDPDNGSGNTVKLAFAEWTTLQNDRYAYICWDTDASAVAQDPATGCLGQILQAGDYSGTFLMYRTAALDDGQNFAAFVAGIGAAINFQQLNGRITFAFRGQTGLTPDITNATDAQHLMDNGYNFYGDYATATDEFRWLYNGQISGPFEWMDGYLDQIWINTSFQTNLMNLFKNTPSVPFNTRGATLIEAAMQDTITAGLNFGAFSPGVVLSEAQKAEVINEAGTDITSALFAQGYYLQIIPAIAQVRAARGPWDVTFWYCDEGAVQKINVNSTAIL